MKWGMGRPEMEEKYGPLESGGKTVTVRGAPYGLRRILAKWSMDVPEIMTVDGGACGEDRFWIRILDKDDRCYVVFEFDGDFDILAEMRADSLAWEGEDFFSSRWR